LMGNHEQLLLLAMRGHPLCARAYQILLELGGDCFLQELHKNRGCLRQTCASSFSFVHSVPRS
jgi:hypothetical protein